MKRIITGIVGILVLIPICMYSYTVIWPLFVTVFSVIGTYEILKCIGLQKKWIFAIPSYLFSLLPLVIWTLRSLGTNSYKAMFAFAVMYFCAMLTLGVLSGNRLHSEKLYSAISYVFYVVFALTALSQLRYIPNGKYIYLLVFLGAWISDTFAFFGGLLFGKHKLCPAISPKKTVEGSVSGILANAVFFALYAILLTRFTDCRMSIAFFAVIGAVLSVVAQLGDLCASCIKRHYDIKDFGFCFPGHGGVLDRFDSVLATSTVLYLIHVLFGLNFLVG